MEKVKDPTGSIILLEAGSHRDRLVSTVPSNRESPSREGTAVWATTQHTQLLVTTFYYSKGNKTKHPKHKI